MCLWCRCCSWEVSAFSRWTDSEHVEARDGEWELLLLGVEARVLDSWNDDPWQQEWRRGSRDDLWATPGARIWNRTK
jgi:hypothetical protein